MTEKYSHCKIQNIQTIKHGCSSLWLFLRTQNRFSSCHALLPTLAVNVWQREATRASDPPSASPGVDYVPSSRKIEFRPGKTEEVRSHLVSWCVCSVWGCCFSLMYVHTEFDIWPFWKSSGGHLRTAHVTAKQIPIRLALQLKKIVRPPLVGCLPKLTFRSKFII